MKKFGRGFTLVEVSLFIAITGLLFIGIAVGTQNSIFQQRYNDSVQSFAEFLRGVYSEVTNVQNDVTGGKSEQAIYGKLVTFGESKNFGGGFNSENAIFSYNVIGNIKEPGGGTLWEKLRELGLNVVTDVKDGQGKLVGMADEYRLKWQAALQNKGNGGGLFKGALLVVRHPNTGSVYTLVMTGQTVEVNAAIDNNAVSADLLTKFLDPNVFKMETLDVCLNPNGDVNWGNRMDVRIVESARNASGIEIVGEGGPCAW